MSEHGTSADLAQARSALEAIFSTILKTPVGQAQGAFLTYESLLVFEDTSRMFSKPLTPLELPEHADLFGVHFIEHVEAIAQLCGWHERHELRERVAIMDGELVGFMTSAEVLEVRERFPQATEYALCGYHKRTNVGVSLFEALCAFFAPSSEEGALDPAAQWLLAFIPGRDSGALPPFDDGERARLSEHLLKLVASDALPKDKEYVHMVEDIVWWEALVLKTHVPEERWHHDPRDEGVRSGSCVVRVRPA